MGKVKLNFRSVFLSVLLGCISILKLSSQQIPEIENVSLLIPDLEILVDAAWSNHGMLAYRENQIEVKNSNLKVKKRYWTRNFGVEGNSRYGTFNNFSENNSDYGVVNLSSNRVELNFGLGFYLKIPVFDVINRRSDIKQAEYEIEQAENLVKMQKDEIRDEVIRLYEDLILKQELFRIESQNISDAKVNLEMAKKEYTNGNLVLYEYIRIADITSGISAEYAKAKSQLMVSKQLLESITGIKIY